MRSYIDDANAVETRSAPALQKANLAYAEFSQGKLSGAEAVRALQSAEGTLRDTRTRLSALKPPSQARRLHAALLAAVGASIGLASESTMLARYTPGARAVATRLKASATELRTRLRGAPAAGRPGGGAADLPHPAGRGQRPAARARPRRRSSPRRTAPSSRAWPTSACWPAGCARRSATATAAGWPSC